MEFVDKISAILEAFRQQQMADDDIFVMQDDSEESGSNQEEDNYPPGRLRGKPTFQQTLLSALAPTPPP